MTDAPSPVRPDAVSAVARPGKVAIIAGWVIGGLAGLALLAGGVINLTKPDFAVEQMTKAGYAESVIRPLGVVVVLSGLLYLLPQTAVLGAILLTAYMGGAVCHHVRAGDPIDQVLFPTIFAAMHM